MKDSGRFATMISLSGLGPTDEKFPSASSDLSMSSSRMRDGNAGALTSDQRR